MIYELRRVSVRSGIALESSVLNHLTSQSKPTNQKTTPMSDTKASGQLDTRGLRCPLPVLKARKALKDIAAGAVLEILATDPGTEEDLKAFCEANGHNLIDSSQSEGEFRFLVRRGD